MKINRKQFLSGLKLVEPGLVKGSATQEGCFVFTPDGRICTFNDNVSVSFPFKTGIVGAVPARGLIGLAEKVKAEEIELLVQDGSAGGKELFFAGSKAKAGLRMESEICLPLDEVGFPEDWLPLPENFNAALKSSLFSAGHDQNKPAFTGIHVMGDYLESCDNNRATRYFFVADVEMTPMLIPAVQAKELIGYKCDHYAVSNGWLHFINEDDVTFSCRYLDEDYPNLDKFLQCDGAVSTFPEGMAEILARASVLSEDGKVNVYLEKNKLIIASEGSDGWFEEEAKVTYGGTPVEFDINPDFLASMLKLNSTIKIGQGRLLFETDEFIHIVKTYIPKTR